VWQIFGARDFPCPVPDAYPVFLNRAIWSSSARFTRGLSRTGLTLLYQGGCCVSWFSSRFLLKPGAAALPVSAGLTESPFGN
jgi:hypothetical protein